MARLPRFGLSFWERRRDKRHRLFEPAIMIDHKGERRAHVLDLSTTGLLLHSDKPLAVGQRIALNFAKQGVVGRVVWVDRKHCGIALLQALDEQRVDEIVSGAKAAEAAA